MLDCSNRTFREKLKEWNMRKADHRTRRKSRSSAVSADSGYASYSTNSAASRTDSSYTTSWYASSDTLITPSVYSQVSDYPSPLSDQSRAVTYPASSAHKSYLNKSLPPTPQLAKDEVDLLRSRNSFIVSSVTTSQSIDVPPIDVPPHSPASQCERARASAEVPRIATLGKCNLCGASTLHSAMAGAPNMTSDNFRRIVHDNKRHIHARDKFGDTPLHVAAASGLDVEDLKVLHAAGADLHARNNKGELFLHVLPFLHDDEWLCRILDWAVANNVDWRTSTVDGRTVLHALCERNVKFTTLPSMWHFLKSRGAEINLRDRKGLTPIHNLKKSVSDQAGQGAARESLEQRMHQMLEGYLPVYAEAAAASSVHAKTTNQAPDGILAAQFAAQSDSAMLEIVRHSQNNPLIEDQEGRNALHCLARVLYAAEPNPHLRHEQHSQARYDGVRNCLEWGVDTNVYDRHGETPLHSFLTFPRVYDFEPIIAGIVEVLLERGADPAMKDGTGNTALHLASSHGKPHCVDALLRFVARDAKLHKIALSARNDKGRSAVKEAMGWLQCASSDAEKANIQECVRLLCMKEYTEEQHWPKPFRSIPNSLTVSAPTPPPLPKQKPQFSPAVQQYPAFTNPFTEAPQALALRPASPMDLF